VSSALAGVRPIGPGRLTGAGRLSRGLGVLVVVGLANLLLLLALRHGPSSALLLGILPALGLLFAALVASDRSILLFFALAVPMTSPQLTNPLPIPGPGTIWTQDLIVVFAVGAWLARRLFAADQPTTPRLRVISGFAWPFALFALAVVTAVVRGHAYYGTSLISQPLRLALYVAIVVTASELSPRKAHKGLVVVFYTGTVWMLLNAAYFLATGQSQTDQVDLSTGGARILSGEVGTNLAFALVLAILNLQIDTSARRRALHFAIAVLATVGVVLSFTRAIFLPLALVLPFVLFRRSVLRSLFSILPLLAPLLVVAGILLVRAQPQLIPTFVKRVTAPPSKDANAQWRLEANKAVWPQVRESPFLGVGFGRSAEIVTTDTNGALTLETVGQEGHDSLLWLLAAGGIALAGSFALLIGRHAWTVWRCLRRGVLDPHGRVILIWSAASLFIMLVTASAAPVLSSSSQILTMWSLISLGWSVILPATRASEAAPSAGRRPRLAVVRESPASVRGPRPITAELASPLRDPS